MSLVVALFLAAWPVPRDAGADAYAQPANWPDEPEWASASWLTSYEDGGVHVDRAWSFTRGSPDAVLAVVAAAVDVSDPLVASAWRLNAAEFPNAVDMNGNGRIDVGDLTAPDVNANGALDLEDVIAAFSDGVDQDGNGRIDDLCGWDFVANAPIRSVADAGLSTWRFLAAPVNDGLPGIGVCPGCTLVPLVANDDSLADAITFSDVRAVLVPTSGRDVSAALDEALKTTDAVVLTRGSTNAVTFPFALHPGVHSPRTTCTASLPPSVTFPCVEDAALLLLGGVGLLKSLAPDAGAHELVGLLGGPLANVGDAAERTEAPWPAAPAPLPRMLALSTSPARAAEHCAVDGVDISCDGGVALAASGTDAFVRFEERVGPFTWTTSIAAPAVGTTPGQLAPLDFGPGSGPPRFVDVDGSRTDVLFAATRAALHGYGDEGLLDYTGELPSGRFAPAFGDLDGDQRLDVVTVGDDGTVTAFDLNRRLLGGFPKQLGARPAGPPVLVRTLAGLALITVDVNGELTHTVGADGWTHRLPSPPSGSPAAGLIDADQLADLAIVDGTHLHVLITSELGVSARSWSTASRATQALLGNLVGDERLEIIVDGVYDSDGALLLELRDWRPSVVPPALARLGVGSRRSLIQVEAVDGAWELTRYDVESAVRAGDAFVDRSVLRRITHVPSRGGFVVADFTADEKPDVLLPTEDGWLFVIDGLGELPAGSPWPTLGTVLSSPALGVARNRLELAVRTTRGDVVRWLVTGRVSDLVWESAGHDRQNTNNAETPLPARVIGGLGITEPPRLPPTQPCSCDAAPALGALALLFLLRRASRARR